MTIGHTQHHNSATPAAQRFSSGGLHCAVQRQPNISPYTAAMKHTLIQHLPQRWRLVAARKQRVIKGFYTAAAITQAVIAHRAKHRFHRVHTPQRARFAGNRLCQRCAARIVDCAPLNRLGEQHLPGVILALKQADMPHNCPVSSAQRHRHQQPQDDQQHTAHFALKGHQSTSHERRSRMPAMIKLISSELPP